MDTPSASPANKEATLPFERSTTLTTRGGVVMSVRPVRPTDEPIVEAFFERVSPADLRLRFLSSLRHVDHERIQSMVQVDYNRTITFLAFDSTGDPIATAMLVADDDRKTAEMAISVRTDMKGRGVGWSLLQHVLRYGKARGFTAIRSFESRQSAETLAVERDAGFEFEMCDGDAPDVIAVKHLIKHSC